MLLSDAILEGAKLRKQGFVTFFPLLYPEAWAKNKDWDNMPSIDECEVCSCALGAALDYSEPQFVADNLFSDIGSCAGQAFCTKFLDKLSELFPQLNSSISEDIFNKYIIEAGGRILYSKSYTLYNFIIHLNDANKFSREKISTVLKEINY